jgi:hypothetical protein
MAHFPHEWLVSFSYLRVYPEIARAGTLRDAGPAAQLASAMRAGC